MSAADAPHAVLLTGTVGAGKTTVAAAVGDLLMAAGVPNAVVDLDELRRSWPCPPGDPFNLDLELRNLGPVAANYLDAGARRLVLAGVVETRVHVERYRDVLGIGLTVCRLRVDPAVVQQRLVRRHGGDGPALRWHAKRAVELEDVLDSVQAYEVEVVAGLDPPALVAQGVLQALGWS
ncbi:MAG: zeta toxin family protein [Geodermatophilaceae bacterium]|nr:zeta toxin family protein [Geodermatophilaceae bacterium]